MKDHVTPHSVPYPPGEEPDEVVPVQYADYRYVLGRKPRAGGVPLVAVCMNPSAARDSVSDRTVNRVIREADARGYDGWFVVNVCPERATDAKNLVPGAHAAWDTQNVHEILDLLDRYAATEVWAAWGASASPRIRRGRDQVVAALRERGTAMWHLGELTKDGHPRHPLYLKNGLERREFDPSGLPIPSGVVKPSSVDKRSGSHD
ncbi:MAG: DUF1643 domain-containing protein [Cellulomonadaceae bacterium]|jgi:hypothetical protein|nr:DUF1643 domain-containing protein [Cellulomonadaceae bacterium]